MTSATERLRALLNECGVEHVDGESMTYTNDANFMPAAGGTFDVTLYERTPEQAIDATLGRGTCKLDFVAFTKDGVDFAGFRCDECGFTQTVTGGSLWGITRDWSYCPNCGRKVVE